MSIFFTGRIGTNYHSLAVFAQFRNTLNCVCLNKKTKLSHMFFFGLLLGHICLKMKILVSVLVLNFDAFRSRQTVISHLNFSSCQMQFL